MLRKIALVAVAAGLFASSGVAAQQGRQRRVEQKPAAAVRAPRAAAPLAFSKLPFAPGERLSYDVSWNNNATAATVVLSVGQRGKYFGQEALPITADVETVGLVKFLASVDLSFKSYSDPKTLLPHRAEQNSSVNGKVDRGEVVFDRTRKVAVVAGKTTPIGAETGDLLALFYRMRALPLETGDAVMLDGYDGKSRQEVKAVVEQRERVATPSGEREAIRVAFLPVEAGAPTDDYKIRVWYTDDAARVPVLVTANPDFGAIRMALRDGLTARR